MTIQNKNKESSSPNPKQTSTTFSFQPSETGGRSKSLELTNNQKGNLLSLRCRRLKVICLFLSLFFFLFLVLAGHDDHRQSQRWLVTRELTPNPGFIKGNMSGEREFLSRFASLSLHQICVLTPPIFFPLNIYQDDGDLSRFRTINSIVDEIITNQTHILAGQEVDKAGGNGTSKWTCNLINYQLANLFPLLSLFGLDNNKPSSSSNKFDEEYAPDPNDSTPTLAFATKRAILFVIGAFILVVAGIIVLVGHVLTSEVIGGKKGKNILELDNQFDDNSKPERSKITFLPLCSTCFRRPICLLLSGLLFLLSALCLMTSLVTLISTFKSEVGIKLRKSPAAFNEPLLTYEYGAGVKLSLFSVLAGLVTSVLSFFSYIYDYQKRFFSCEEGQQYEQQTDDEETKMGKSIIGSTLPPLLSSTTSRRRKNESGCRVFSYQNDQPLHNSYVLKKEWTSTSADGDGYRTTMMKNDVNQSDEDERRRKESLPLIPSPPSPPHSRSPASFFFSSSSNCPLHFSNDNKDNQLAGQEEETAFLSPSLSPPSADDLEGSPPRGGKTSHHHLKIRVGKRSRSRSRDLGFFSLDPNLLIEGESGAPADARDNKSPPPLHSPIVISPPSPHSPPTFVLPPFPLPPTSFFLPSSSTSVGHQQRQQ